MAVELRVLIKSHHFVLRGFTPRVEQIIRQFIRPLIQWDSKYVGHGQYQRVMKKVFAASTADNSEYRLHINQLIEFRKALSYSSVNEDSVVWEYEMLPTDSSVELKIREHIIPRDYQVPIIDFIVNYRPVIPVLPDFPFNPPKLVGLQTGKGKGISSMKGAEGLQARTLVIVKAGLIPKWIKELREVFYLEFEDLMVIQGGASFMALLRMKAEGKPLPKILLLSNKTMQIYLTLYKEMGYNIVDAGYEVVPDQLYKQCNVKYRIIDEVHNDFHLNYLIDLHTHVEHSTSLSATLMSDDPFIRSMQLIAYPDANNCQGPPLDQYIHVTAITYGLKNPSRFKWQDYATKRYSHNLYEKHIMRYNDAFTVYKTLIKHTLEMFYFKVGYHKKGDRFLVFCASIDMCTRVRDYLAQMYPHLDIRRYCEDDPFDNLMEADGCVSTLQSAGTAVDIDQLTTVVMSTAISSSQSNVQGTGRLRKLKDDRTPQFAYFLCTDIPTHIKYHEKKTLLLTDRVKSTDVFNSSVMI